MSGLAEQAELSVRLDLKGNLQSGLRGITSKFKALNLQTASASRGLKNIGRGLATGVRNGALLAGAALGFLALNVRSGIDSLVELEQVTYQTNARIKSTQGIAGITADKVRELAETYEDLTTVDDKVIQGAENILLSYTNVRKDAFEPALSAALDLSKAMGMDLTAAIKLVGRSLDDPTQGLSKLTRAGITFTDQEKDQIAALQESGDLLGAQTLILDKLKVKFGDAAKSIGPAERAQKEFGDAVEDTQMALSTALLPALTKISQKLKVFLKSDEAQAGIKRLGDLVAGLFSDANIGGAGDAVKGVFGYLAGLPWGTIKDGLTVAAEAAKKAVDVFKSLPPGVQTALITLLAANKLTGGLVASGLGELLKVGLRSLTHIMAGNVTVIGGSVTGGGGVPVAAAGGGLGGMIATVSSVVAPILGMAWFHQEIQDAEQPLKDAIADALGTGGPGTDPGEILRAIDQSTQGTNRVAREGTLYTGGLLKELGGFIKTGTATTSTVADKWGATLGSAIRNNSRILAAKRLSVNVSNHTNVRISARQVVSETETFTRWGGVVVA